MTTKRRAVMDFAEGYFYSDVALIIPMPESSANAAAIVHPFQILVSIITNRIWKKKDSEKFGEYIIGLDYVANFNGLGGYRRLLFHSFEELQADIFSWNSPSNEFNTNPSQFWDTTSSTKPR